MMRSNTLLFSCTVTVLLWADLIIGASISEQDRVILPKPITQMTLEESINIALQHSPLIKQAKLNIALAELDVKSTSWWKSLLPSLNIIGGYDPLFGDSRFRFGLTLDLVDIIKERDDSKRAKIKLFDAQLYLNNIRAKVKEIVSKSFLDFRLALEQLSLCEEKLAQDVKLLELAKVKFETGRIELDELLKHQYILSEDKLNLLKAKSELQLKELKLRQDIGADR